MSQQADIDQIYLCDKDPFEANCQFFINKWESKGLNYLNNSKSFIEYSNNMNNIYENVEEYTWNKKHKILIVFDDMNADMLGIKKKD